MNKTKLVEKIHKEFHVAFDEADRHIRQVAIAVETGLANAKNPVDIYDEIADLGFKSIREVRENKSRVRNREVLTSRQRSLKLFQDKIQEMNLFMNHRIITMPQIIQILEKYHLFIGPVKRYTGSMPTKNAHEIAEYKKGWDVYQSHCDKNRKGAIRHNRFSEYYPITSQGCDDTTNNLGSMYICAPLNHFEKTKNKSIVGREVFYPSDMTPPFKWYTPPSPPDPIVLNPISFNDSWLDNFKFMHVCTAWGIEAANADIVNANNN